MRKYCGRGDDGSKASGVLSVWFSRHVDISGIASLVLRNIIERERVILSDCGVSGIDHAYVVVIIFFFGVLVGITCVLLMVLLVL